MNYRYILGIETTCDDTSIGIFDKEKNLILANETISSLKLQASYGGVVPELASRKHEENINLVLNNALLKAQLDIQQIDAISYSNEPGLMCCLFVGKTFAELLHLALDKPIIPVNHLYAHIFSGEIAHEATKFPAMGVVASGGHTALYLLHNYQDITLLNQTHDDAVGEVYDKVARALGFPYPGGPKIDQLFDSKIVDETIFNFSMKQRDYLTFSGLKTAVISYINQVELNERNKAIISSTFQKKIIDMVIYFVRKYLSLYPSVKTLLLGGGVSANSYLQSQFKKLNRNILIPERGYTNDNGAMIAYYASKIV